MMWPEGLDWVICVLATACLLGLAGWALLRRR